MSRLFVITGNNVKILKKRSYDNKRTIYFFRDLHKSSSKREMIKHLESTHQFKFCFYYKDKFWSYHLDQSKWINVLDPYDKNNGISSDFMLMASISPISDGAYYLMPEYYNMSEKISSSLEWMNVNIRHIIIDYV